MAATISYVQFKASDVIKGFLRKHALTIVNVDEDWLGLDGKEVSQVALVPSVTGFLRSGTRFLPAPVLDLGALAFKVFKVDHVWEEERIDQIGVWSNHFVHCVFVIELRRVFSFV